MWKFTQLYRHTSRVYVDLKPQQNQWITFLVCNANISITDLIRNCSTYLEFHFIDCAHGMASEELVEVSLSHIIAQDTCKVLQTLFLSSLHISNSQHLLHNLKPSCDNLVLLFKLLLLSKSTKTIVNFAPWILIQDIFYGWKTKRN